MQAVRHQAPAHDRSQGRDVAKQVGGLLWDADDISCAGRRLDQAAQVIRSPEPPEPPNSRDGQFVCRPVHAQGYVGRHDGTQASQETSLPERDSAISAPGGRSAHRDPGDLGNAASLAGTTRPTPNQVLRRLAASGIVAMSLSQAMVLNRTGLHQRASQA